MRRGGRGSSIPTIAAVGAMVIFLGAVVWFFITIISGLVNPPEVTYMVPDLVNAGVTVETALANKDLVDDFTVEQVRAIKSDAPIGQIIEQSPVAGTVVKAGERKIQVTVSAGNGTIFIMKDYYNKPAETAKAEMELYDIKVELLERSDEAVTKTYVVDQSVEMDTELKAGDTVTLWVSTGPELKPVPMISLIGLTRDGADQALRGLGLILGTSDETYDAENPVGTVIWQSVTPNTTVNEKTVIDVKLSKGPDPNVSPSPDPEPTEPEIPPETTPPVSPPPTEPEGPKVTSQRITVELPTDRDTVTVVITVAGQEAYRQADMFTNFLRISPTISGSGAGQEVNIYFDDVLAETRYLDF